MALITKNYTFSAGAVIVAAEHNSNFDTVYNVINGNLNTANISPTAAIALSQISFATALTMSGAIINGAKGADVASTAGTITLGNDGNYFDITGTAAITSITAKAAGTVVILQFDSTASLVDGSNLKLAGNFTGAAEAQIILSSDGTNWFEVARNLTTTFTPSVTNALSGSVIQTVNTQSGAVATGTTVIPSDDTIPQNTEGDEYITRAITPNNASNLLKIEAVINIGNSNNSGNIAIALFQDTTASALAAVSVPSDHASSQPYNLKLTYYMTAGTTSSTTFKIRGGNSAAGTTTFNGAAAARLYGGVMISGIFIQEIKA